MSTSPKAITDMLEKTTLVDDDLIEVVDSAETNKSLKNKKVKYSTFKSGIPVTNDYIVPISNWDMDTDSTKNISIASTDLPSPLDLTTVAGWSIVIWNDANSNAYNLESRPYGASTSNPEGAMLLSTTTIFLERKTGGIFDSASFSDTGSRGNIIINLTS